MEITEVRISLRESESKRLKAYATVTFDNAFVVRSIKVVEGNSGLFVAMPAKKVKQFCSRCGKRIDVGGRYCSYCGMQLPVVAAVQEENQRQVTHQDVAHPINQQFRDYLQASILDSYYRQKEIVTGLQQPLAIGAGDEADDD